MQGCLLLTFYLGFPFTITGTGIINEELGTCIEALHVEGFFKSELAEILTEF